MKIRVGMKVGAKRWGMVHAHPNAWLTPHKGTVLSSSDPRAWHGTYAMGYGKATPSLVRTHLKAIKKQKNYEDDTVPVLWDFGNKEGDKKVYWEKLSKLRTCTEDFAEWKKKRILAYKKRR